MGALAGKVGIVTGASTGIGAAAARLFAAEGASLVINARGEEALQRLTGEIEAEGGTALAVAGDVKNEEVARALVAAAVERFGGLDFAFNNAGALGPMAPTAEVALEDWETTLAVNLTSGFLAAKHQAPTMAARGGGSLVFTSTFVGYTAGFPGVAAYAASKSGLIGLVQALTVEYGPKAVRVNALCPGATDTPMYRQMNPSAEQQAFIAGLTALRRVASPEEMARSALYLVSDASSFTTGSALLADGGVSVCRT